MSRTGAGRASGRENGTLRNDHPGIPTSMRAASRQVLGRAGTGICAVDEQRVDHSSLVPWYRPCRRLERVFILFVDDTAPEDRGFRFPAIGGERQDAKTRRFPRRMANAAPRLGLDEHPFTRIDLASVVMIYPTSGM